MFQLLNRGSRWRVIILQWPVVCLSWRDLFSSEYQSASLSQNVEHQLTLLVKPLLKTTFFSTMNPDRDIATSLSPANTGNGTDSEVLHKASLDSSESTYPLDMNFTGQCKL